MDAIRHGQTRPLPWPHAENEFVGIGVAVRHLDDDGRLLKLVHRHGRRQREFERPLKVRDDDRVLGHAARWAAVSRARNMRRPAFKASRLEPLHVLLVNRASGGGGGGCRRCHPPRSAAREAYRRTDA